MEKKTLRRTDLAFSVLLMLISIYVFFQSISLFFNPFGRDFARVSGDSIKDNIVNWYTSPALLPFILAIVLFICAFFLFRNARKEGASFDFLKWRKIAALVKSRETHVCLIVVATLCLYIFALMPLCRQYLNFFPTFQSFPFMIATFVYLAITMIIFNEKSLKKVLISLLVAAVAAAFIAVGFGVLAMIPLP